MKRLTRAAVVVGATAGFALIAGPASAAPPESVPPITVTAVDGDDYNYEIVGAGCIGTEGTPGTITVYVYDSAGEPVFNEDGSPTYTAEADGSWGLEATLDPSDSYVVKATCDIYGETLNYPDAAINAATTAPAGNTGGSGTGSGTGTGTGGSKATGPELAATGADTDGLGWLAGGLVASGAAALYAGRRRKTS
ncbi:LPXTG cell wall anchor domain-containing protein [Epidermidibacterium keratini]|uniref:LPXTG cell wall anchor domain-containing protein n=1 Tax=Epidermidibacterium keratini TaxID=1891644 RepID=UPI001CEF88EE|nr:LPXTG cell wall anchor domain-containing protein [Epidermidibacterium keratini]